MKIQLQRSLLTLLGALGVALTTGAHAVSQSPCYDFGSMPVAARCDPSPVLLGCQSAPRWPQWHLLVPAHRAPCAHAGYRPGNACRLPCVLVTYRCTGLQFLPVTVRRIRWMGYVIDQPEYECAAGA